MRIRIGYELIFDVPTPTPMMVMLFTHPSRVGDLEQPEFLITEPDVPVYKFNDPFGNVVGRLVAPPGQIRFFYDNVIRDSGVPDDQGYNAYQHEVQELPPEVLPYLLASRYCEVDRMTPLAWQLFGHTPLGWPRVQAVLDYVHDHITFGYQYADCFRTAQDGYNQGRGVCRDFMHLAITFLRALNIPARYATGYLGDIGVPPVPSPMDFSAWFEVYMGGRWWTQDARHNKPRIGRVLQARGRDAVDVALTTSFGAASLRKFKVWTDEIG